MLGGAGYGTHLGKLSGESPMNWIIDANQLEKVFKNEAGENVSALRGVSFRMKKGEIIGVLGPDGAGKSTLIRIVTGLMKPSTGQMRVFGFDVAKQAPEIQKRIGYMPQRLGLYEDLTVQENLVLYARLHGICGQEQQEKMKRLLRMASLERFSERLAGKLSGGMKQKLALCCCLISSPKLMLLDEPTVGVDPMSRRELWMMIQQAVKESGMSVLASTSYMDESGYCDRVLVLYEGEMLCNCSPDQVIQVAEGKTYRLYVGNGENLRTLHRRLANWPAMINVSPEGNWIRVTTEIPVGELEALSSGTVESTDPEFADGFMMLLNKRFSLNENNNKVVVSPGMLEPQLTEDQTPVIVVQDLVRKFGLFTAVDHVSFCVKKGEIFGLLGPNGAGKTTTFRMLCGLLSATAGTLKVADVDLQTAAPDARRKIGYVAQKFSQYGNLTAAQNLDFFAGAYGMAGSKKREAIARVVHDFELSDYLKISARLLPGGYKQRLGMACALLHEPEILFLDEATSGADPIARREFWNKIHELADRGVTIVITTHFLDEAEYCDRMIIMMDGVSLAQGSPLDIRNLAGRQQGLPIKSLEEAFLCITKNFIKRR